MDQHMSAALDRHITGNYGEDQAQRVELEDLKASWRADPCWDIEKTEGFEWAHDELLAYRKEKEAQWASDELKRLEEKSHLLGCPGNHMLVRYIETLEYRISQLERIEELRGI